MKLNAGRWVLDYHANGQIQFLFKNNILRSTSYLIPSSMPLVLVRRSVGFTLVQASVLMMTEPVRRKPYVSDNFILCIHST
jgi:hypothetical protein